MPYNINMSDYRKKLTASAQVPDAKLWDLLSLLLMAAVTAAFIIQWKSLPFFLDMYYHLGVAKGFETAGGIVGRNFWEYGSQGAAHIYPPLLHAIMASFLKIGINSISLLKILSIMTPPSLLSSLWLLMKRIEGSRKAFFLILLCTCSSLFLVTISFTPAATLGTILLILGIYALNRGAILSSAMIFGLIFYTHTGIAAISFLFLLLAICFNLFSRKNTLKILIFSAIIALPWLTHIIKSIPEMIWQNTANMPIKFYPIIIIFFIIGFISSLKDIRKNKLFFIFFLSMIAMGILYPFRLFSGQGMICFIIFAALGLDRIYALFFKKLQNNKATEKYQTFFLTMLISYLIFFAPSVYFDQSSAKIKISDSLFCSIFEGKERDEENILSTGIFNEKFFKEIASSLERYSDKGDFIWSNYRYVSGILWSICKRPTLSHMLLEVNAKIKNTDPGDAKLLIIIDEPEGEFKKYYPILKNNFSIAETIRGTSNSQTIIYILSNNYPMLLPKLKIIKPYMRLITFNIILIVYIFIILMDKLKAGSRFQSRTPPST